MVSAFILPAQRYSHSPNDSIVKNTSLGATVVLNITQLHPGNDTLHFRWKKQSVSLPSGWSATICDNGFCFTSLEDSGSMIPIVPGDKGLMSLHCSPAATLGTGVIRYTLYEDNTPNQVDTLTWIIHALTTGIEIVPESGPTVYVENHYLHISATSNTYQKLTLYDLTGREIFNSYIIDTNTPIDIASMPSGIMIARLYGENKNHVQKIINQ